VNIGGALLTDLTCSICHNKTTAVIPVQGSLK
jgi:cytochrome c5